MAIRSLFLAVICLCLKVPALSQVLTEFPRHLQFYARGEDDSAVVPVRGYLSFPGYDSVVLEVFRGSSLVERSSTALIFAQDTARFTFSPKIRSELAEYHIKLFAIHALGRDQVAAADSIVAGDVYFIAGQSNAVLGRGDVTWKNEFCRTFGNYNSMYAADTNWAVAVADTNLRNPCVGVWALNLQKQLVDVYKIPICIINGAVGGKGIESMLRNSSDPEKLTTVYGMMLYRARKSGLAQHAKAMLWYQGESNNGGTYLTSFSSLYAAWKDDYPNLNKIYVFQIRPGCNSNREHAQLRDVQRRLASMFEDIRTISTTGIPYHDGCHYSTRGYELIADRVFKILSRDFYGSTDTAGLDGPNIVKAFYTNSSRTEIALMFSPNECELQITSDTMIGPFTMSMKDYFYLDDASGKVAHIRANQDTLLLTLNAASDAAVVTYLPDKYYSKTQMIYQGPWVLNERGVGAFAFWHFPIDVPLAVMGPAASAENFSLYPNPANGSATIAFSLESDDEVTIELYDVLGRKLSTVFHQRLAAGAYRVPVAIEHIADRAVIARMSSLGGSKSIKCVLSR